MDFFTVNWSNDLLTDYYEKCAGWPIDIDIDRHEIVYTLQAPKHYILFQAATIEKLNWSDKRRAMLWNPLRLRNIIIMPIIFNILHRIYMYLCHVI